MLEEIFLSEQIEHTQEGTRNKQFQKRAKQVKKKLEQQMTGQNKFLSIIILKH